MQSSSKDRTGNSSPNESVFLNTNNGKDNKVSKKGQKVGWSHEENVFLWEAYIRSKILSARTGRGFTFLMKEIWDGKDFSVRSQASLVLHVGRIKGGLYLSDDEKEAVERRVREEFSVGTIRRVGGNSDTGESESGEVNSVLLGGMEADDEERREGEDCVEGEESGDREEIRDNMEAKDVVEYKNVIGSCVRKMG